MDEQKLREAFDKAEKMGFDRGVRTIMLAIFQMMEKAGATYVTYHSLKTLYKEYEKETNTTS